MCLKMIFFQFLNMGEHVFDSRYDGYTCSLCVCILCLITVSVLTLCYKLVSFLDDIFNPIPLIDRLYVYSLVRCGIND